MNEAETRAVTGISYHVVVNQVGRAARAFSAKLCH